MDCGADDRGGAKLFLKGIEFDFLRVGLVRDLMKFILEDIWEGHGSDNRISKDSVAMPSTSSSSYPKSSS